MWTIEDFERHNRILQTVVDTVEKAGLSCTTDDYPMIAVYDNHGVHLIGMFHADDIITLQSCLEEV